GLHDLALLHAAARDRLLNGHNDGVTDGGVAALGAAQHLDALQTSRAGVVGHVEIGLHLNHGPVPYPALTLSSARSSCIETRRPHTFRSFSTTHRLFFEIGLLSSIHTMSPTLKVSSSSWA